MHTPYKRKLTRHAVLLSGVPPAFLFCWRLMRTLYKRKLTRHVVLLSHHAAGGEPEDMLYIL